MTPLLDWEERGRELGPTLGEWHAIVVTGADAHATAQVALGIGRVQAQHRRVAIGDLFGDTEPLQSLVDTTDPHGLVDSFMYGISLNKIAYLVPDAGELFIMPSGTGPMDYDELFVHPRWRRLAAGFREVGALLLVVAPADAPRLRELVNAMDGAVLVGDTVPAQISVAQSFAWLRPKRSGPTTVAGGVIAPSEPAPEGVVPAVAPRDRRRVVAGVTGLLFAALLLAGLFWFAGRPFASKIKSGRGVKATSPAVAAASAGTLTADSVARLRGASDSTPRDSLAAAPLSPAASDSFPVLAPVNAGDSAVASSYAVRLEETTTKSGAILDLRVRFESVPAATYGFSRERFFLVAGGAYPTHAGADSLLAQLRTRKVLAPGNGRVAALPFAFLVQADVPIADVPSHITRFNARGLPVYALRQPNGAAHLYFGAYENPQQAAFAVPALKEAGFAPTLVYRIGRVF